MEEEQAPTVNRVLLETLTRWNIIPAHEEHPDPIDDPLSEPPTSPFPFDEQLNEKLILWHGPIVELETDAVVNSTNESLSDRSGLCGEIFRTAGPELAIEVSTLEGCRTGESKITKAYNLPARFVIHTVGPRYNIKYKTAAENALHSCYRSCLQMLIEHELKSIGFCVINSAKRGYPKEEGAHIAFRTIRRFLEHFGRNTIESIVLAVDNLEDLEIYQKVLKLYFPRNKFEERQAISLLPEDIGNEMGETVIRERQIRIAALPGMGQDIDEEEEEEELPKAKQKEERQPEKKSTLVQPLNHHMGAALLASMDSSPDDRRRWEQTKKTPAQLEAEETDKMYASYISQAQKVDLSDMARRNFIYQSGQDASGRNLVMVIAANFPNSNDAPAVEKMMMHILRTLDSVSDKPFVLLYFHANMVRAQRPEMAFLKKLARIFSRRYESKCEQFNIIHPSFWVKVTFTILRPWLSAQLLERLRYTDSLAMLFDNIDREQMKIPTQIYQFDSKENGSSYGDDNPANEGL